MNLELTAEQAEAVEVLLRQYLPELSHEIAGTDNAEYRSELTRRREGLVEVQEALVRLLASPAFPPREQSRGARTRACASGRLIVRYTGPPRGVSPDHCLGARIIWVHRNSAIRLPVDSFVTSASQTSV